jgi:hypothetical protein
MYKLLTTESPLGIIIFTILALVMVLVLTFKVEKAKKKAGLNFVYMFVGGLFLGFVGIRAKAIDNLFFFYMVVLFWNLIAGTIHIFLADRILEWTKTEHIGWRLLYSLAIVLTGFAVLLTFMEVNDYTSNYWRFYNLSAVFTFFIPMGILYCIESYMLIPQKVFLRQKPWIYNRSQNLQFKSDEISHFFIIKYKLTAQTGAEVIESLPMRAPGNIKLGDYFNSTLEVNKVTQGRYTVETRDSSNNSYGWFFFLSEGNSNDAKMIDPNKTFLELGFTNSVYFSDSNPDAIEAVTRQAEGDNKCYTISCKREIEYKSQLSTV